MTVTREDDKPWKTDLARKAAQRREMVGQELEEVMKKGASFEDALHQAVEMMKKRFARFSAVTAYVADGEGLAVHTALRRAAVRGALHVVSLRGTEAGADDQDRVCHEHHSHCGQVERRPDHHGNGRPGETDV